MKSTFDNSKWQYLSFALMGILAIGGITTAIPQASAHITTNVQHMLEDIYSFVDGIEAKTNNLPADPASNTVVNTRASQQSATALQTTADEIKSKTINLPADPASQSSLTDVHKLILEILPNTSSLPPDPASETTVNSRASQASVDSLTSQYLPFNFESIKSQLEVVKCNATFRSHVVLTGCNLSGGEFDGASLSKANISAANLSGASLSGANLSGSDLNTSNLSNAILDLANLSGANLNRADLTNASFRFADLTNANLAFAKLSGADFSDAITTGCTGCP